MDATRRLVLRSAALAGLVATAVAAGVLKPGRVLAQWPVEAFAAKKLDDALAAINARDAFPSRDIEVKAPDIAENGAVVPVEVATQLADVHRIAFLGEKNVYPLVAVFDLVDFDGALSTRIKMGQTSDVRVVVWSGERALTASKTVKVTAGGCGG